MDNPAKRAIIVGMDGAGMKLVKHMAERGHSRNIADLIENGVYAHMVGVHPTLTPPGWTSLTTGTWPTTHKVMDFNIYSKGKRLDETTWGINTSLCQARYIWDLVEDSGKRPILVKWEMSWPPTIKKGVQVEGTGPGVSNHHQITGYHLFVAGKWAPRPMEGPRDTEEVDPSAIQTGGIIDPIRLVSALSMDWKNLPDSVKPCLEAELIIKPLARGNPKMQRGEKGTPKPYYGLVYASGEDGYDRVSICRERDGDKSISDVTVGKMSDWWRDAFEIDGKFIEGNVQMKLIALSRKADVFELFTPQIWPIKGYTYPKEVAEEILTEVGPFLQNPARDALGYIDDETYFELLDYHHNCLANVTHYLAKTRPWNLIMTETHASDYANHFFLHHADKISNPSPEIYVRSLRGLERTYRSIDGLVGRMKDLINEETVILLCSDHGGTPNKYRRVNIADVLEKAGLLVYKKGDFAKRQIDWSRTKAAPQGVVNIFINLKGREPTGIVPSEEYENTQHAIINAIYSYRQPENCRNPFSMAVTRDDAAMFNLTGDLVGDVIYAIRPEFDGAHGHQLPTAVLGISGQHSTFILAGAGVRSGVALKSQIRVVDVVPTLCHLLGMTIPKNVEGRIIYEALEDY